MSDLKIFRIFKEILNYLFLLRTIRKHKDTEEWKKHKLRIGWFGTFGTIINLPPDVFQGEPIYYKIYVIDETKPINRYLESLNLHEIITLSSKELVNEKEGEYAFLITYSPLFIDLTFGLVLKTLAVLAVLTYVEIKFHAFSTPIKFIYDLILSVL